MQMDRYGVQAYAQQLCWLPLEKITPRPSLGMEGTDDMTLTEMVASIRRYGLMEPITVQPLQDGRYMVVAGNRRLMACRMAGLSHIDAVVLAAPVFHTDIRRMQQELLGGQLHYLHQAETMQRLMGEGMSREELARMLGVTVSTVREKLRLLELDEEVRGLLLDSPLPEKCAHVLLRLPDRRLRLNIARQALRERLGVRDVELLVKSAQSRLPVPPVCGGRTITLVRDHRLYLNAIRAIVAQMRESGVEVCAQERTLDGCVEMTLRLPTRRRRSRIEG